MAWFCSATTVLTEHVFFRSLDLDHEFVCQVRADPRKTLCVVVGTAMVEAQSNIHMKVKRKGEEKEDAARVSPAVQVLSCYVHSPGPELQ